MRGVRYHVALAFGVGFDGQLFPIIEEAAKDQRAAVSLAEWLSRDHAGAVAFSRTVDIERGRYGPAEVHLICGRIPRDLLTICGIRPTTVPRKVRAEIAAISPPAPVAAVGVGDLVHPGRWQR